MAVAAVAGSVATVSTGYMGIAIPAIVGSLTAFGSAMNDPGGNGKSGRT
jgi:hypothetical protein